MKTHIIIRKITLTICILFCLYSSYYFIVTKQKIKDCGIILSAASSTSAHKNNIHSDFYLNIEFENHGFQTIETTPTTYFKYKDKLGSKVCFDLTNEKINPFFWICGFATIFAFIIICFVLFIGYLIEGKNWLKNL